MVANLRGLKFAVRDCARQARKRGYRVFAVQNGGECFMGPRAKITYKRYGPSKKCRGGKGAPWANDVYKIIIKGMFRSFVPRYFCNFRLQLPPLITDTLGTYNSVFVPAGVRHSGSYFQYSLSTFLILRAPVPGKPISANRGLNLANRGWKFILRLDSVPESTINTNQVINEGLNLIHLARSINSLIGEKNLIKTNKIADLNFAMLLV